MASILDYLGEIADFLGSVINLLFTLGGMFINFLFGVLDLTIMFFGLLYWMVLNPIITMGLIEVVLIGFTMFHTRRVKRKDKPLVLIKSFVEYNLRLIDYGKQFVLRIIELLINLFGAIANLVPF